MSVSKKQTDLISFRFTLSPKKQHVNHALTLQAVHLLAILSKYLEFSDFGKKVLSKGILQNPGKKR